MDTTPPPNLFVRTFTDGGQWRFHGKSADAYRETFEGVAFAIILAFLFKTFLGEAFIIPTGSMASTLQGRHLDVSCPKCGSPYRVGASGENNEPGQVFERVYAGVCPNCGYRLEFNSDDPNQCSFAGDRIIVSKFHYDFYDPQRWHVIVFKYPGNAKQNYIKRLVGLPEEMLRIYGGNVHRSPLLFRAPYDEDAVEQLRRGTVAPSLQKRFADSGVTLSNEVVVTTLSPHQRVDESWRLYDPADQRDYYLAQNDAGLLAFPGDYQILRKPAYKVESMLQLVHDSRHVAEELVEAGWPTAWRPLGAGGDVWSEADGGRRFAFQASGSGPQWLAYEHLLPDQGDWDRIEAGEFDPALLADRSGQLITDLYPYNEGESARNHMPLGRNDLHWVGDLAMEAQVRIDSGEGRLLLELVRAGARFQCELDCGSGEARLRIIDERGVAEFWDDAAGQAAETPVAKIALKAGSHRVKLANVDNQVLLWIDGGLVEFPSPTTYRFEESAGPQWSEEEPGDLKPARLGAEGLSGSVERLRVFRDVYYIATACEDGDYQRTRTDYDLNNSSELTYILEAPPAWESSLVFSSRREVFFFLGPDQFFPMGDNSPQSKDARLWAENSCDARAARVFEDEEDPPPPYVHRKYLIGEALVVYWPHAWRLMRLPFSLPIIGNDVPGLPNFGAMRLIR